LKVEAQPILSWMGVKLNRQDGYMGFIGVTTGSSSIMKIFPHWAEELGLPTKRIVGHDLKPNSSPHDYQKLCREIKEDDRHYGALVTTHKVNIYESCQNIFDELDDYALEFGEISAIAKHQGKYVASAKDPVTVRQALEQIIDEGYFAKTNSDVLCLGSGGSGIALTHQLGVRKDSPRRIVCTARSEVKLDALRKSHLRSGLNENLFEYVNTKNPDDCNLLIESLSEGSIIINATGMGKDIPGSPLSDNVNYPYGSIIWDFNYRGSLEFLAQAQLAKEEKNLRIVDGWQYFIYGWVQAISEVFEIEISDETIIRLDQLARAFK